MELLHSILNGFNYVMGIGGVLAGVFTLVAAVRGKDASKNELERASMRSMSWPSAE